MIYYLLLYSVVEMVNVLKSLKFHKSNALQIERAMIQPIYFDKQIFIFGGFDKEALRTCFSVSFEPPFTSRVLQPIQHARYNYSATIMGGKIYVAGGTTGTASSSLASVERYDPVDDKWTEVSNMNFARTGFALVELNGMLYAMGHHKSVERFDPAQNVWTVIGLLDDGEQITGAVNLRNEIHVLMKNGIFGILKVEPDCSLQHLESIQGSTNTKRYLYVA